MQEETTEKDKFRIISMIKNILKTIIVLVIVAIFTIILVQRVSNNENAILGIRLFTVATESMIPEYNVQDVILVIEKPVSEIKVGDDIAYSGLVESYKDKAITHRVIKIEQTEDGRYEFHTKGISNDEEDPVLYGDQVYGVVVYKSFILTFLNRLISNKYGLYLFIILPLTIILISEIRDLYKFKMEKIVEENKQKKDEKEQN